MLTEAQERYLQTIPEEKIAVIKPWDPGTVRTANKIIKAIKTADPGLEVLYTGASSLEIPGVNDVDLCILSPIKDFKKHLPKLKIVLGIPQKIGKENIRWEGVQIEGYQADVHMTDPNNEQLQGHIRLVEILKNNPGLRAEYGSLKEKANGIPYREYQRRKYEFYNRILPES